MRKGSCASHFRDVSNFFKVNLTKGSLQTHTSREFIFTWGGAR